MIAALAITSFLFLAADALGMDRRPIYTHELNDELVEAAETNNNERIIHLLFARADINNINAPANQTPLHRAVRLGHEEAIRTLLKYNADVSIVDGHNKTPLDCALRDCPSAVSMLRNACTSPDYWGLPQWKIDVKLCQAACAGDRTKLVKILDRGANVNCQAAPAHATPLHESARQGNLDCLKELILRGADLSIVTDDFDTPLHIAAELDRAAAVVALFPQAQCIINALNRDGKTPLHYGIKNNSQETVKFLLAQGADPNLPNPFGQTPLKYAKHTNPAIADLLSDHLDESALGSVSYLFE